VSADSPAPRVFTCHASEDKARFVVPFALGLRNAGIDAWVDQWEIRAGDSIVRKIFDDGLGNADAAIIVLSRYSIEKPWVREELDSAFMSRVEGKLRIIPVIIEDCIVPAPLRHLRYIRIKNLANFQHELGEVIQLLFDFPIKPPLGSPPNYLRTPVLQLPGLTQTDAVVFSAIGDQFVGDGHHHIDVTKIREELSITGINAQALHESLEVLSEERYIEAMKAASGKYLVITLLHHGADVILKQRFPDYSKIEREVGTYICNNTQTDNGVISENLSTPVALVNHILDDLAQRNLIKTHGRTVNGGIYIFDVSARLKRLLTG
jgi:hypothetical protein